MSARIRSSRFDDPRVGMTLAQGEIVAPLAAWIADGVLRVLRLLSGLFARV